MKQRVNADISVEECIAIVKDIFLENYLLFTRCWDFLSNQQPMAKSFGMWYARPKSKSLDAVIYSMSVEEMVTVQLIGTSKGAVKAEVFVREGGGCGSKSL